MTDDYDEFTKRMTSFDLSLGEDVKMEPEDSDDRLFHHGVKGMKWGVRRARKEARKERDRKQTDAVREFGKVEARQIQNASAKQYAAKAKAYESGASHRQARKAGHQAYRKEFARMNDRVIQAEQTWFNTHKQANAEYKARKSEIKNEVKIRRAKAKASKDPSTRTNLGKYIIQNMGTNGMVHGYDSARRYGATKNQAKLSAFLAGPAGGVAYREIMIRRNL